MQKTKKKKSKKKLKKIGIWIGPNLNLTKFQRISKKEKEIASTSIE